MIDECALRSICLELRDRYETAGWGTFDTLGALLSRALSCHPDAPFRVHSSVRPCAGAFSDVERVARRPAGGLHDRGVWAGGYRTGDIRCLHDHGYLTIGDRKLDPIIRGGENTSALEFEGTLLAVPGAAQRVLLLGARTDMQNSGQGDTAMKC